MPGVKEVKELIASASQLKELIDMPQPILGDSPGRKAVCSTLYESPIVRLLLGEALHPGGLKLTRRLVDLMEVQHGSAVLDVGCARGASASAMARTFQCRIVGIDMSSRSVAAATRRVRDRKTSHLAGFVRGDAERIPIAPESFDNAICECAMSLLPDKAQCVAEIAKALKPGGRLGVSDVAVQNWRLPETLQGSLGQLLCVSYAPSVEEYRDLLNSNGLSLVHEEETPESIIALLNDVQRKLSPLKLVQRFSPVAKGLGVMLLDTIAAVAELKAMVNKGVVSYRLFIAEKG